MDNNRRNHVVYNLVQRDGELRHMRHEKRVLVGVVAFSVVYDSIQQMEKNGSFDLVLFQDALAEFKIGYGHPFKMEACWRILKNYEAWIEVEMPSFNQRPLRETLEEEERAKKELEERLILKEEARKEQAHDKLFRLEFKMKSDSEYKSD
nr:hypothetical protein [Tanacetum cinerariifolium]